MKIIISPAKKMNIDTDTFSIRGIPVFMDQTNEIMQWIQALSWEEAKSLWKCNGDLTPQSTKYQVVCPAS